MSRDSGEIIFAAGHQDVSQDPLGGCTPKGPYDNTRDSKNGPEKVLGGGGLGKGSQKRLAFGSIIVTVKKVLRRVLRKGS